MCRPTLNRVSYLLYALRYLLTYIGELYRNSHLPLTVCSFMMRYCMNSNIPIIQSPLCSPSGWISGRYLWSASGEILLHWRGHTIPDCFCPFDLHSSADYTVPYHNPAGWWDPQIEIPELFQEIGLIVWPNIGVCMQEYSQDDWQITKTQQSGIISILTYGIYKTYSEHGKVQYKFDYDMRDPTYTVSLCQLP